MSEKCPVRVFVMKHVGIMKENLLCKRMFHARTVVMQVVLSKIRCNARESVIQEDASYKRMHHA